MMHHIALIALDMRRISNTVYESVFYSSDLFEFALSNQYGTN
jgi:hypothetical protein